MARRKAASEADFLVKVQGIDDYFATLSGGDTPVQVTRAYNGGDPESIPVVGKKTPSDITVTRPYDVDRDGPLCKQLRQRIGEWVTTVSKEPTRPGGQVAGNATIYSESLLVNVMEPEANAASSAAATMSLVFSPARVV